MTGPDVDALPVEAVVFDLGGVLLDWDPAHLYREVLADEAAVEHFLGRVCTLEWHHQHDEGRPMAETIPEHAARHPEHAEAIALWEKRYLDMFAGPIDGTVDVLGELRRAGVPVYALTNMPAEVMPLLLDEYPFLAWFDGMVVSGDERLAKPAREIFDVLCSRFELDPPTTVFVDDRAVNVDAAVALGFRAIPFVSPAQVREELALMGVVA
jgi:2-haloacid dehalogenase